jgi:hypothetical protein
MFDGRMSNDADQVDTLKLERLRQERLKDEREAAAYRPSGGGNQPSFISYVM